MAINITHHPSLILGNSNKILELEHRINGKVVSNYELKDGLQCLFDLNLDFPKFICLLFWIQERG